ncbi:hypothetical protein ACQJBY_033791 [Aegilops geniculata]
MPQDQDLSEVKTAREADNLLELCSISIIEPKSSQGKPTLRCWRTTKNPNNTQKRNQTAHMEKSDRRRIYQTVQYPKLKISSIELKPLPFNTISTVLYLKEQRRIHNKRDKIHLVLRDRQNH